MTTATEGLVAGQAEAPAEQGPEGPRLYRLTVDQYMKMAAFLEEAPRTVAFMERHGIKFQHVNHYADYHHNDYPGGSPNGSSLIAATYDLRRLGPWADKLRSKGAAPPVSAASTRSAPRWATPSSTARTT